MAAKDDFPAGVARDALCAVCNEPADSQCSACKVVRFCSSDHAKEGWKKHKPTCKAMKRLNSSGRSWEKVITTEGTGEKVGTGKMAEVHYVGTLANGIKFDSSRDKGRTFKFPVGGGRVIRGWDEGVAAMKVGERCMLYLAPDFAYGVSGHPPAIPANAHLVFDVELLAVEGAEEKES